MWMISIGDHPTQMRLGYDERARFTLLSQENRHEDFRLMWCGDFYQLDRMGPY